MLRLLIKLYSRRIDYLFFGKTPNCPKLLGLLWYFNFLLKELFLGYLFALLLGAVIPFVDFLSFFSAPKRVHTCIIIIFFCRLSTFVLFFFLRWFLDWVYLLNLCFNFPKQSFAAERICEWIEAWNLLPPYFFTVEYGLVSLACGLWTTTWTSIFTRSFP